MAVWLPVDLASDVTTETAGFPVDSACSATRYVRPTLPQSSKRYCKRYWKHCIHANVSKCTTHGSAACSVSGGAQTGDGRAIDSASVSLCSSQQHGSHKEAGALICRHQQHPQALSSTRLTVHAACARQLQNARSHGTQVQDSFRTWPGCLAAWTARPVRSFVAKRVK
jgi:hypothetical protein